MKKLMLFVSITSALALSGCGGSDAPATDNNNGTGNNGAGSSINTKVYGYDFTSGLEGQGQAIAKSTLVINSGLASEKIEYPSQTSDFKPYPEAADTDVLLTQNGLYEFDSLPTAQGSLLAYVDRFDDEQLVYTPYSKSKDRSLKFTVERQKVNLSGKKLSDVLFLGVSSNLIKPIQQSSAVFPQGSMCWRELSVKSNMDAISFYSDEPAPERYQTLDDFAAEVEEDEVLTRGLWSGVPWITSTYQLYGKPFSYSAVYYNGKVYNAADTFKANQAAYGREMLIARYEAQLKESPNSTWINEQLNELKNSCDDFNQVAADAIDVAVAGLSK